MASKVMVKIPEVQFTQVQQLKKSPVCEGFLSGPGGDAALRIAQLEQNIRFLQDQHRVMLAGLHREIESLMEKNRDLQYQLVFSKTTSETSSPKSNPDSLKVQEDEEVVRLERELVEAREAVRVAEVRCRHLQAMLDSRTQSAGCTCSVAGGGGGSGDGGSGSSTGGASCEEDAAAAGAGSSADAAAAVAGASAGGEGELARRLAAAERLVRRLRREGADHRRELQSIKASLLASGRVITAGRGLAVTGAELAVGHAHAHSQAGHAHPHSGHAHAPHSPHPLHQQHFPPLPGYWHPHHPHEYASNVQIGRATSRTSSQRPALPDLNLHSTPIHYANGNQQHSGRQRNNGYTQRRSGNALVDEQHQVNDSDLSPNLSRQGSELSSRHSYRARRYHNNHHNNQNGKPSDRT